ncbi:MAG TPA: outer membrane beta-barrel family protein [Pedobacter sp.]|nr:outer membrane beta-barrel family protein [Pedobacter sp.]
MKISALLVIMLAFCAAQLSAQTKYIVRGIVADSMATYKLINTTITLLNEKDSTLVKYARANAEGSFSLTNLKPGKFILLVTYPGYADYADQFALDTLNPIKDFGNINLILKSTLLQDVIIRGKAAAIRIKGDTTEFNAGSYNITPNSKVEDLLKQLPGIQVDKDGKITAQGQTVNKVLVDGEEFFGDDPTLVTKNIRGDMVDKVQLYDKKSDQATFTGIEDGEKSKTINIKLKEDKKNGYFGKAEAGIGTDKFYQNQIMFNAFKGKQRISGYSIFGNTGQTGLGWNDNDKYSGSNNMEMMADGGMMVFMDDDEFSSWDGRYNGQGIPAANNGGLHYENKWNSDKHALNTNYKIGQMDIEGTRNNISQQILPDRVINSSSDQQFNNRIFRQKLDAAYTLKIDSTSTIKFSADGALSSSNTSDNFNSRSLREDNSLINTGERDLSNDADKQAFNLSAFWTKKLKKKGRTLSLLIRETITKSDSEGFLNSTNKFYNENDNLDSTRVVDQQKVNISTGAVLNTSLNYTEPLSKTTSLIATYGLGINNSHSDRRSYNRSASGAYDELDLRFSNDFKLDQLSNKGGLSLNYMKDKTSFGFGTNVTAVRFGQTDKYTGNTFERNFINWNPQARYSYRFSQQKSFRVNYYGNTTQPDIDDIQPVRNNTDPLNISLGNPALRPSYSNNLSLSYNSYKILSEQSLWMYGSYNFTFNPITSSTVTEKTSGKNTYQSVNLKDKRTSNYYFNMSSDRKIKSLNLNAGFDLGLQGSTNYTLTDNVVNSTTSGTYTGGLNISKYKENKYSFRISGGPNYNTIKSSLQNNNKNNGWGFNTGGNVNIYLPGKLEIGTDGNYEYKAGTQTFDRELSRFIWNAAISKKFFKEENLRLSLSGRDLLNQNVGFSRYANANMVTQDSYTTIKRYFMLSLSWDFNKMGGAAAK